MLQVTKEIFLKITTTGIGTLTFKFVDGVECITESHKITGRLHGKNVKIGPDNKLIFKQLAFFTNRYPRDRGVSFLTVIPQDKEVNVDSLSDLLSLLFTAGVLDAQNLNS
jgi:hypothetical protein